MLDYILISPLERQRLGITLINRPTITSHHKITREGAYNI